MVEKMLERCDERATSVNPNTALLDPNDPMRDCHNTWVAGIDYFRMDGSTSVELRKRWIEMFNNEDNPRGRLFLISTRAGSLGTNLVGANRVVIMDASWNPTHDIQAIFRVYRFGQKKPVFIYRFLAQGTMEEKIYDRQVNKQSLSCRVVDEQQIERHFNAADLQELYTFSPDSKSNRPTPMVPKDRLLAELLIRNKDVIVSYHEHDSLLQNITEEDLTEEERKTAWEEYKDEREGRINMDNGLGGTFLNQQGVPMASWVLDVSKIVTEIRAREPHLTSEQVIFRLKGALVAYRDHFRRQQMKAFEKRTEYIRLKQPVPQEIAAQLSESAKSIEQINKVLLKMENMPQPSAQQRWQGQQGMPQQGMPQQGMPQQGMPQQGAPFQQRMPQQPTQRGQPFQGVKQQGMPQSRRQPQQQAPPPNFGSQYFTAAYNLALSRGVDPGSARSYAMFHRDQIWKQMNGIPAQPEPVVVEADENAGPQRRAPQPQPSNSSVVITEISD